jgi:hypothetical protein
LLGAVSTSVEILKKSPFRFADDRLLAAGGTDKKIVI